MSHQFWLLNETLLSLFLNFTNEFNIQEFSFHLEDFMQIQRKKAFLHPKENELEVIEVVPRYPFNFCMYVETDIQTSENCFLALREFDETTSLVKITKKNSVTSEDDATVKNLVIMEYDVRRRISGTLDLNISVMKFLDFKIMGQNKLADWIKIFRKERINLHSFPFLHISNEVVLKLKTKY